MLCLQLLEHALHLLAQTDGVTLRYKYYAVESVGDDEHRHLLLVHQLHLTCYLLAYRSVLVEGELHGRRQTRELVVVELGCVGFALEEQHYRTAPCLERFLHLLDVVQSVVGRFLTYAEDAYNVIAATGL